MSVTKDNLSDSSEGIRFGIPLGMDLPKWDLEPFTGDPRDYYRFMTDFRQYVEDRVPNPGDRFRYLCHYCRDGAQRAVRSCSLLPANAAYDRAKANLYDRFGRINIVTKAWLNELGRNLASLSKGTTALLQTGELMMDMVTVFSAMNHEAELNASMTLEWVVRQFPSEMRLNWARKADAIESGGVTITFECLAQFVSSEARIASGPFGESICGATRRNMHAVSQATTNSYAKHCVYCNGDHELDSCEGFKCLSVNDRWNVVKEHRLCFKCMRSGHRAPVCQVTKNCSECNRLHHVMLHSVITVRQSINCSMTDQTKTASLGVLTIMVSGPNGSFPTNALIDDGSDMTLIDQGLAKKLGCTVSPRSLTVATPVNRSQLDSGTTSIRLSACDGSFEVQAEQVFIMNRLKIETPNSCLRDLSDWPHLRGLHQTLHTDSPVEILIGTDIPAAHWALEQRIGLAAEPFARKTPFGWIVLGPTGRRSGNGTTATGPEVNANANLLNNVMKTVLDRASNAPDFEEPTQAMKKLFDIGFEDTAIPEKGMSMEDRNVVEFVQANTCYDGKHYCVPMPWKFDPKGLPNNYAMAFKRLQQLENRFDRDHLFKAHYCKSMDNMVTEGFARKVNASELQAEYRPRWYLPHHAVTHPRKPDKLRVVLDCAAKNEGISLNDYLLQGPDVVANLLHVLLRFRKFKYAIAADVEAMYMQVKVPSSDQGALRFLWRMSRDSEIAEYQMTSHPFGAKSSSFCAVYALSRTIRDFNVSRSPEFARIALESFYVDDFLASFDEADKAKEFVDDLRNTLDAGGFKLKKWISNHPEVLSAIPESNRSEETLTSVSGPEPRMLGLRWDPTQDDFIYELALSDASSRRRVLSTLSSIFDPVGLISPLILPAKMFLQDLCRKRMGWDDPMPESSRNWWQDWVRKMNGFPPLRIPRALHPHPASNTPPELHVFCDASEKAYGAVVYARGQQPTNGRRHISLVYARSRVAPVKTVSIPRLELTAATLAVKMASTLKRALGWLEADVTFWTDSLIVIYYIRNSETRYSVFVSNRLSTIRDLSEPIQWQYVPSELNPADLISRGTTHRTEFTNWLAGPKFLYDDSLCHQWIEPTPTEAAPEIRKDRKCFSMVNQAYNPLLNKLKNLPSWIKVLRRLVWWSRFKSYVVSKSRRGGPVVNRGSITVNEIDAATFELLRMVQREHFPNELSKLSRDFPSPLAQSSIRRLNPILTDGIIRVNSRLHMNAIYCPAIVPRQHWMTELIVEHYHRLEGHCGLQQLIPLVRERFWIIDLRSVIKKILNKCWLCRRVLAKPLTQQMAPLEHFRKEPSPNPFSYVGVDYFGPFLVKRGRSTEKRYGCLFSCLQIRAVHIELAHDLTTDSFIMALMRFVARRGTPMKIYSDNGTNLVGAVRELKHAVSKLDSTKISNTLLERRIDWTFNPPHASHRGGLWERMIRSVRRIIVSIAGSSPTNEEILHSVMVEAERVMNNRPLVPVSTADETGEVLSPSSLLIMQTPGTLDTTEFSTQSCRKRWHQVNQLSSSFWRRWSREYVQTLHVRQKWLRPSGALKRNDAVLIVDSNARRDCWRWGVVTEVIPSFDGVVRTAKVKTSGGEIRCDVRRLCLMEAAAADETKVPCTRSRGSAFRESSLPN